ncbi:SelT/SelW/SelH family protein [Oceanospirillum linum]|uniref:SelT/SelW/SelH family protein n=1 Tax=Oceanospirillum linum TaxID=966 RepID=UPI00089E0EC7|nr:SelT/SelW/SelH family protein [Oceanospirillum linum]SEG03669.1 selenoprotein W-related protein [Oleiphilus messinensis]SMP21167.1 selenoprotein W-related protein [Oceanospirillum linum]
MLTKAKITIFYCTQCNWMLRAAWIAQEILHTFSDDLAEVALAPSTGGRYEIWLDDILLWERKADAGFPEAKEIKQRIRDAIDPERSLGHSDTPVASRADEEQS